MRPGQRITAADHLPPDARTFLERDRQRCARQAPAVGAQCAELMTRRLSNNIAVRLRAAQGVIALGKRYGAARLEAACARALAHDSPHYRSVKSILFTGADQLAVEAPQTPAAYASARFVRSAAQLFGTPDLFGGDAPTVH